MFQNIFFDMFIFQLFGFSAPGDTFDENASEISEPVSAQVQNIQLYPNPF